MPVRRTITATASVYFTTFYLHQPDTFIYARNRYDVVFKWFNYLKEQKHHIIGYIIMPNHVPIIIANANSSKSINIIVSNGKCFSMYELVQRLKQQHNTLLLNELSPALNHTEKMESKLHKVFKTSFDRKECRIMQLIE